MSSKKFAIIISGIIGIVSFLVFIFLQLQLYRFIGISINNSLLSNIKEAGLVISGGCFTSSFVTFLISIKEYQSERKKALEKLFFAASDILISFMGTYPFLLNEPFELIQNCLGEIDNNNFNKRFNESVYAAIPDTPEALLLPIEHSAKREYKLYLLNSMCQEHILRCKNLLTLDELLERSYESRIKKHSEELELAIDSYLSLKSVSAHQLTVVLGELDFLFANRTIRRKIHKDLYQEVFDKINFVEENLFHFEQYKKGKGGNRAVQCHFINKLQTALYSEDERFYYREFCFRIDKEMTKVLEYANGRKNQSDTPIKSEFIIQSKPHCF